MKTQGHNKYCACYYCYLKSPEWKEAKRKAFLQTRTTYCQICKRSGEEWHHYKGYAAIWTERDFSYIILLCATCHHRNHFPLRGGKTPLVEKVLYKRYLWLKRTYPIRNFRPSIFFAWLYKIYGV